MELRKIELYTSTYGVLHDDSYVATVEIAPFADSEMPDVVFWGARVFESTGKSKQHNGIHYADRPWTYMECTKATSTTAFATIERWEPPAPKPVDVTARDVVGVAAAPGEPDTTLMPNGQQKGYVVLSADERAKGFVRQVRRSYIHVGRKICGKRSPASGEYPGIAAWLCSGVPGHDGRCPGYRGVTVAELKRFETSGFLGGCGTSTSMGRELAETYARKPDFYGGTFCSQCSEHFPVGEHGQFVWEGTEERVGT